jgi:hypothetical protein
VHRVVGAKAVAAHELRDVLADFAQIDGRPRQRFQQLRPGAGAGRQEPSGSTANTAVIARARPALAVTLFSATLNSVSYNSTSSRRLNTTRHGLAARSRKNCTHAACPGSEGNRASTATLVSSNSASGGDQSGAWKERTLRVMGGRPLRATGYRRRPRRARTKSTCTSVLMRLVARSMFAIRSSTSAIRGGCTRARHDSASEGRPLREARRVSALLAIGSSYPTIHSPSMTRSTAGAT